MKIAVRCIYYLSVTPNFLIVDLPSDKWQSFLWERDSRINIIRQYLRKPGPSIREVSWIPLEGLSEEEKSELSGVVGKSACSDNNLST